MRYKTLFYNVEPIAKRLPDDCLKIVISYAYDDSAYNAIQQFLTRYRISNYGTFYCINLFNSYNHIMYTVRKWNGSDVIDHFRLHMPIITFKLQTNIITFTTYDQTSVNNDNNWYFDSDNIFHLKKLKTNT